MATLHTMECHGMQIDDIRRYNNPNWKTLWTDYKHNTLTPRLTQYFSAHSRVRGQLKMNLGDDNPIKDSLSLSGMQPQNTLALLRTTDDQDMIIIYLKFSVPHTFIIGAHV